MAFIVTYVEQEHLDLVRCLTGKEPDSDAIERMMSTVRCETEGGAKRLVNHLRGKGCIARYHEESL